MQLNNYTLDSLKEEIEKYFQDYIQNVDFVFTQYGLIMRGYRKHHEFTHAFNLDEINNLRYSFHHYLEDLKGRWVRKEQVILLEHQKN